MPTVEEILRQSGFTDDQIKGLDPKAVSAFGTALSTADQERKAAADALAKAEADRKAAETAQLAARQNLEDIELKRRANTEWYEKEVVTALNRWEDEKKKIESDRARAAAEAAFYKTQAETAKTAGFIPADAPTFVPPANEPPARNPETGRYVPNAPGSTPGSPTLVDDVRSALSDTNWAMREYGKRYNNGFLPDDPIQLAREAEAQKLPFRDYVARKYSFTAKDEEMRSAQQKAHDDEIRAAMARETDDKFKALEDKYKTDLEKARQEWAERAGSNPDVRAALPSRMAEVQRAVKAGDRPDPLKMSNLERHQITRRQINDRITEQEAGAVA